MTVDKSSVTAQVLGETITYEFFRVLGIQDRAWLGNLVRPLIRRPIRKFSELAADFDTSLQQEGVQVTADRFLRKFVNDFEVFGAENIPPDGPLIIASNHPGSVDGLLLLAGVGREDIRAIASGAPFLKSFPNFSRYLLFSTSASPDRFQALRGAYRHLQHGGCLLTFPTGLLDPDPAFMAGAADSFDRWHASLALLTKKLPETSVVPAIISGVLEPRYFHHPITKGIRDPIRRQKFAEYLMALQVLRQQGHFNLTPQVSFGEPIRFAAAGTATQSVEERMAQITERARATLAVHLGRS
jgi:1-acyl-sn-glycerol-3-phosphate acyltransferase